MLTIEARRHDGAQAVAMVTEKPIAQGSPTTLMKEPVPIK